MGGRYEMRVDRPGAQLSVTITLRQGGETVLAVGLRGTRREVSARNVIGTLLRHPFGGYRVPALIRMHGVRLWLGRIPVQPRQPHVPQRGVQ